MKLKKRRRKIEDLELELKNLKRELSNDVKILQENCSHTNVKHIDGLPYGCIICEDCDKYLEPY